MVEYDVLYKVVSGIISRETGISANEIQRILKGTEYAARRTTILQISKEIRVAPILDNLDTDGVMKEETRDRLKSEVLKYAKTGSYEDIKSLNDTLFSQDGQPIHEETQ